MGEQLMEGARKLVEEYALPLGEKGIRCTVFKKYCEASVHEPWNDSNAFSEIERSVYNRRERKYKHQPNRYHSLVLRFSPTEQDHEEQNGYKEYAFLLRKIEREHTGLPPQKTEHQKASILRKIEKRIKKILRKAETRSAENVCRDTLLDALRYTVLNRYAYKKTILGKDRSICWLILAGAILLIDLTVFLCIQIL